MVAPEAAVIYISRPEYGAEESPATVTWRAGVSRPRTRRLLLPGSDPRSQHR